MANHRNTSGRLESNQINFFIQNKAPASKEAGVFALWQWKK